MINRNANSGGAVEAGWVRRNAFQIVVILFLCTEIGLWFLIHSGASLWFAAPIILLVSHFMHGASVGLHEASHGLLRKNKWFNEFDGILLGVFSFMSFSLYRAAHQSHHAYFATERDEELWPFVLTETPRWARILAAFLELTLGLLFLPFLFLRAFLRPGSPIRSRKVRRRIWVELVLMLLLWLGILSVVIYSRSEKYFLLMYLLPAFLAGNLQTWRKYIEHVGLTSDTVNGSTRSIVSTNWPGRLLAFTLLHEPFHGVHHLHMGLPHSRLPERAGDLVSGSPEERPPFTSYRDALMDLMRSLSNPRVGGQWHTISMNR